jgi:hypothetical protein
MHAHDVRMIQRGERLRLALKVPGELLIIRPFRCEQFQRDESVQQFLPCLIDHAHAATAQALDDIQLREVRREFICRERRCLGSVLARKHRVGGEVQSAETAGAKAVQAAVIQRGTAARAENEGRLVHIHLISRSRRLWREAPKNFT